MPERVFADTNLFLRYLTNDVPAQADAVEALLKRAKRGEVSLVTNALVMAEIVWTLESFYKLQKAEIRDKVLAILNTSGVEITDSELVLQAVAWYADKNVDYIDAYNAAWMPGQGLAVACTFDQRHFSQFEGIKVAVPTSVYVE